MSASVTLDLVEHLYGIAVADAELLALLASEPDQEQIRMRYRRARPDDKFPYLVHLLKLEETDTPGVWAGEWIVDAWDYGPDAATTIRTADRLKAMYDRRFYEETSAGSAFSSARIWWKSDDDLSEDSERIQRRSLRFGVRVTANAHVDALTGREGA